jgi:hypothetical protein
MAKKPSHIAYYAPQKGNDPEKSKGPWTKIGAGWMHKDGKGLTIDLEFVPVGQRRIVVREWEAKPRDAQE